MKNIFFKIVLVGIFFAACKNSGEKKDNSTNPAIIPKPTEEHYISLQAGDSNTKQYISVNFHNDTTLMKALITKLSAKDSKGFWDTVSPMLLALLPILLGFLGYKYAIRQMVAKQRLDWISLFRPLVSKLITEIVKAEVTFGEMYNLHEEFTNAQNEVTEIEKEVSEKVKSKKPIEQELTDKLSVAKLKLTEKTKEKTDAEKQYKIDFFVMYQLLHEVIINLDTALYPKQKELEQTIRDFQSSLDLDTNESPENLSQELISKIQEVIAEQRRLAEGKSTSDT